MKLISNDERETMIWNSSLSKNEKLFVLCVNRYCSGAGNNLPSACQIANDMQMCRDQVYIVGRQLIELGIIEPKKTSRGKWNGAIYYRVNFRGFASLKPPKQMCDDPAPLIEDEDPDQQFMFDVYGTENSPDSTGENQDSTENSPVPKGHTADSVLRSTFDANPTASASSVNAEGSGNKSCPIGTENSPAQQQLLLLNSNYNNNKEHREFPGARKPPLPKEVATVLLLREFQMHLLQLSETGDELPSVKEKWICDNVIFNHIDQDTAFKLCPEVARRHRKDYPEGARLGSAQATWKKVIDKHIRSQRVPAESALVKSREDAKRHRSKQERIEIYREQFTQLDAGEQAIRVGAIRSAMRPGPAQLSEAEITDAAILRFAEEREAIQTNDDCG